MPRQQKANKPKKLSRDEFYYLRSQEINWSKAIGSTLRVLPKYDHLFSITNSKAKFQLVGVAGNNMLCVVVTEHPIPTYIGTYYTVRQAFFISDYEIKLINSVKNKLASSRVNRWKSLDCS